MEIKFRQALGHSPPNGRRYKSAINEECVAAKGAEQNGQVFDTYEIGKKDPTDPTPFSQRAQTP